MPSKIKIIECPEDKRRNTTWSKLQEVESPYVDEFDTRQISECLDDTIVLVTDDQRATTLTVATVTHLAKDLVSTLQAPWSELQEVESPYVNEFDTGQVSECLDDTIVLGTDDQRATTLTVAMVTHLAKDLVSALRAPWSELQEVESPYVDDQASFGMP
jgi:hypothetical protein